MAKLFSSVMLATKRFKLTLMILQKLGDKLSEKAGELEKLLTNGCIVARINANDMEQSTAAAAD